jgi:putative peptidoglycan lipid II flippase
VLAASGVMAALLFAAGVCYPELSKLFLAKEIAVIVVCGVGAVCYGACLFLFGAVTPSELKAVLRREPGAAAQGGGLE